MTGFLSTIQFYWPGLVFTLAQAVTVGLTVLVTWAITRAIARHRMQWQDHDEMVTALRRERARANELERSLQDERAESGRLRSLLISNTALAAQLMQNHEAATELARRAQG